MKIHEYFDQIRYRVQTREAAFRKTVDGLASHAGATGLTGAMVRKTLEALTAEFDATISELLDYLQRAERQTSLSKQELYQATVQVLEQSAIAFKAGINRKRLLTMLTGRQIEQRINDAEGALDALLHLRLVEFRNDMREGIAPQDLARRETLPAADRYVTVLDNQKVAIARGLGDLQRAVSSSNSVDFGDREIALSEIAAFEATIVQPRVSTELIGRFIKLVQKWVLTFSGAVAIAAAADAFVKAVAPLLAQ